MPFIKPKRGGEAVTGKPAPTGKPKPSRAVTTVTVNEPLEGDLLSPINPDIPPHVWSLLQQAGETAAARLVAILQSPRFPALPASSQKGLIELALTRAYGLPIRKALNVNLSSTDADAVAASLSDLSQSLPENMRHQLRDSFPAKAPTKAGETQGRAFPGGDSPD